MKKKKTVTEKRVVSKLISKKTATKKKATITKAKTSTKTIRSVVDSLFAKSKSVAFETVKRAVKQLAPKSKFDKSHFSWYRHQILTKGKRGKRS